MPNTYLILNQLWHIYLTHYFVFIFLRQGNPGCPGTLYVDQDGLECRHLPVSVSQILGLNVFVTSPSYLV